MATAVYKTDVIYLLNGTRIEIYPLKIKYLRYFMTVFNKIKNAKDDEESLTLLSKCGFLAMQQYYPKIKTLAEFEDQVDLPTVYKIVNIAGSIKIEKDSEESIKEQANSKEGGSNWDSLDLAKLESEVFLIGIWKDYKELEENLSMPELLATLSSLRELDYQEKKFLAAIQGIDIDADKANSGGKVKGQKEWEDMKARVFSKGKATDSNDVLALQGQNARKSGFGIGMGLDYTDLRDPSLMKK
jgi:hypothetical protein